MVLLGGYSDCGLCNCRDVICNTYHLPVYVWELHLESRRACVCEAKDLGSTFFYAVPRSS